MVFGAVVPSKAAAAPSSPPRIPQGSVVEAYEIADVTGDGLADHIYLVGSSSSVDTPFRESRSVVVIDGAPNRQLSISLGNLSAGYPGSVIIGRINPDRIPDIVVSVPTGGSGGTIHCFAVTMAGGKPKQLVNGEAFARGPELAVKAEDGRVIKVEDPAHGKVFSIPLASSESGRDAFDGYYSPAGKIEKPVDVFVDPASAIEIQDGGDGPAELVSYQKVWAVLHANSVAVVRTVWSWVNDGLRVKSVTVTPYYTPDQYRDHLRGVDRTKPATAVVEALEAYRNGFRDAPLAWRESAFLEFKAFHEELATAMHNSLASEVRGVDGFERLEESVRSLKASEEPYLAGFAFVYDGERMYNVVARPGFYIEEFGPYLSAAYRDYIALADIEANWPWAVDGALVIPLDAVGARVRAWEAYIEDYPSSPFAEKAREYYRTRLTSLLIGLNNTPHRDYETGELRPGVIDALRRYVRLYPDADSARIVNEAIEIYRKNGFKWTSSVSAEILKVVK
jgi:hypothetical protein